MPIVYDCMSVVKHCPTEYGLTVDTLPETFGSVVRERMRQRRVSPKELASVIHRSESQVSLLLRDRVAIPAPDVVAAIASHLGLDETRLVRLIGYLTTVPEEEGVVHPWLFGSEDVRSVIAEELAGLSDEQAEHVLATIRFIQGGSTNERRVAAGVGHDSQ